MASFKVTIKTKQANHEEIVEADSVQQAFDAALLELNLDPVFVLSFNVQSHIDRQEAVARISELTNQAREILREAEAIADQAEVSISWDLAYGMGGWYESGEWRSSSSSC